MLITVSIVVLLLIGLGLAFRKTAKAHIAFMSTAFLLDLALLLYIEFSRQAIASVGKSFHTPAHNGLIFFHVSVSVITLLLYIVQAYTGMRLAKGDEAPRLWHRKASYLFVACRLLNFVTSFFVPQHVHHFLK